MLFTICANSIFFSFLKRTCLHCNSHEMIIWNFFWPAWRINTGICAMRRVWAMSLGCLCSCRGGSCVPAVLFGRRGATEPPEDPCEGTNNIRVIVTDCYDLSKCFPTHPMHLLLFKLLRVTMGGEKNNVGIVLRTQEGFPSLWIVLLTCIEWKLHGYLLAVSDFILFKLWWWSGSCAESHLNLKKA